MGEGGFAFPRQSIPSRTRRRRRCSASMPPTQQLSDRPIRYESCASPARSRSRPGGHMGSFRADVLYALRTLRKNPIFTLTAAVTLALGIGATTAIFSVVKAVLLQPRPYREPDRLMRVVQDMRNRKVNDFPIAPADFADMRDRLTAFDSVAGFATGRQTITLPGESEPQQIRTGQATS